MKKTMKKMKITMKIMKIKKKKKIIIIITTTIQITIKMKIPTLKKIFNQRKKKNNNLNN